MSLSKLFQATPILGSREPVDAIGNYARLKLVSQRLDGYDAIFRQHLKNSLCKFILPHFGCDLLKLVPVFFDVLGSFIFVQSIRLQKLCFGVDRRRGALQRPSSPNGYQALRFSQNEVLS